MKIAIIGTGTAGILSLCYCLTHLDSKSWEVYSINDPNKPILGVGESTSTQIPCVLHDAIGFNLLENANELDATLKLAVKFSKWRDRDFYNHITLPSYAMHFDNTVLRDYVLRRLHEVYDNFFEIHGNVSSIEDVGVWYTQEFKNPIPEPTFFPRVKVKVNVEDKGYDFDYVIDCGGYPEDYSDYKISKRFVGVNNCLVYNVNEPVNVNYTEHIATPNGWLFRIPLRSRQEWGYLYNDNITTKEDAIKDFKENYISNMDVGDLREFKFKSYVANTVFDGKILKNGDRAFFYEPIEAFNGYLYEQVLSSFFGYLNGHFSLEQINDNILQKANEVEWAIAYIYHGGSIYNTTFLEYVKESFGIKLNRDRDWKRHYKFIKERMREDPMGVEARYDGVGAFSVKNWVDLERNLGYDIF